MSRNTRCASRATPSILAFRVEPAARAAAARVSDWLVAGTLFAFCLPAVTEPGSEAAGTVLTMYGETLLLSVGTVGLLKGIVNRPRPVAYRDEPDGVPAPKRSAPAPRSFPSGHTTHAFAAAVFLGSVHARLHPGAASRTWVWAGGLAAATTVGCLRVRAGRHFPSDVIAGAVLGSVIGAVVPRLHRSGGGPNERGRGGAAPSLGWGFAF